MPTKAPTACSVPGCPERAALRGRCIQHATHTQRQYEQARGTSTERGYNAAWRAIREVYLREYPFCVQCWSLGKKQYATDVDHILPKRQGGTDDYANLRSLCHAHHSARTAKETGGFGNAQQ